MLTSHPRDSTEELRSQAAPAETTEPSAALRLNSGGLEKSVPENRPESEGCSTPQRSVSDFVAELLLNEGISLFFGIPGIQNLSLYAGLRRTAARAILIANEEAAAFACAGVFEASMGAEMACVNIIGGPGVTHALAGIALAMAQQIPMLVLTAGIKRSAAHASHHFQLHDVDNLGMLRPVTKMVAAVASRADVTDVFRNAVRVAATPPYGPVAVELPVRSRPIYSHTTTSAF